MGRHCKRAQMLVLCKNAVQLSLHSGLSSFHPATRAQPEPEGGIISSPPPASTSPTSEKRDYDYLVILAALLCALICVLGLVAVARCALTRYFHGSRISISAPSAPSAAANKGLKKKVLRSLPKLTYGEDERKAEKLSDCAICLSEFVAGEELRVIPRCGHGFHVGCIDTWLKSHSSCPSCRQVLPAARCLKCGGLQPESRENHVRRYLP